MADSATISTANATRTAVERSVDAWQQGARGVSSQVQLLSQWPIGDLQRAWDRYFEYLRHGLEVNQELIRRSVGGVTAVLDASRGQLTAAADAISGHGQAIESWLRDETQLAEHAAREQSDKAEQVERERARQGRQAQREQQERDHDRAREQYQGLTKAELGDRLAERSLPKTGTVDELIERLVESDSA